MRKFFFGIDFATCFLQTGCEALCAIAIAIKTNAGREAVAQKSGVALLVGAGDAIGAAVARRFATGGFKVCIARRDAGKIAGPGRRAECGRRRCSRLQRRCPQGRRGSEAVRRRRADRRPDRGLPVQRRLERQQAAARHDREAVLQGLGARLLSPGSLWAARRQNTCSPRGRGTILFTGATASMRGGKGFAAFSSAKFGLRAVAQSMARELGPKNIHVVHLLIDAGVDSDEIRRRYKAQRGIEADANRARQPDQDIVDRRGLLVRPSAEPRWLDPRARSPARRGEVVT